MAFEPCLHRSNKKATQNALRQLVFFCMFLVFFLMKLLVKKIKFLRVDIVLDPRWIGQMKSGRFGYFPNRWQCPWKIDKVVGCPRMINLKRQEFCHYV